jgi:hypothetical protein
MGRLLAPAVRARFRLPVADHQGKVVNPRAGSRWLFAFAALSELPLEPGTWSSLRYVVAQWSKELANVGRDAQRVRKRDCGLSKKNPRLIVSMQPEF